MLLVAMSCLHGRPMVAAFDELAALGAALQLTPGNQPTPGFAAHVAASGVPTRRRGTGRRLPRTPSGSP